MGKPIVDMTGKKLNRWTVLSEASKPSESKQTGKFWSCVCDCGTHRVMYGATLRQGSSKSCGCLKAEKNSIMMKEMRLKQSGSIEDRFFSRFIKMDSGCWQWTAHADKNGYGVLPGDKKNIRAHRLSYEIHVGQIPKELFVCHRCDNPGCVNPDHLFLGTAKDNNQDSLKKGRHYVGEKNGRAKLTWEKVKNIRQSNKSKKELAIIYEVSVQTIKAVKNNKVWKNAT